jgi:hypothetical protein
MAEALWYYEEEGRQAGPVSGPALEEAIRGGRLARGMRVWRAGFPGWLPWEQVPELAALAPPEPQAAPPALPGAPAPAPEPWSQPGAAPPRGPPADPWGQAAPQAGGAGGPVQDAWGRPAPAGALQPVGAGATMALALVTFSIWGMVKFYQCALAYEQAGQVARPRFARLFWIHFGLGLGSAAAFWSRPLSLALAIGSVVLGALALRAALDARDAAVRATGARADLLPAQTHLGVWVGSRVVVLVPSSVLAALGLVGLVFQAWRFFSDHDALAAAAGAPRAG